MNSTRINWPCALAILLLAATATAQPGTALEFESGDYVVVDDPVDVRGPLTIEAWIRPDAFDAGRIVSNRFGGGYEIDVNLGDLRFTINNTVRAQVDISAHQGSWVHVAATWAGPEVGTIATYVNGELAVTGLSYTTMQAPADQLWIGSRLEGSNPFDGAIDELRIFSAVLDHETIAVWHTREVGPGHPFYAQLEAAWCFEEGEGQVAACTGPVSGRDGRLGADVGADDADPAWIGSGITPVEMRSFSAVKALFDPQR